METVERAKGILAREKKMPEAEAFRLIQKQSMNTRRSMREIADAVILTSQIKP
jgi:response regulator NasT